MAGGSLLQVQESREADVQSARAAARQRFTLDGSDALEAHLEALCTNTRSAVEEIIPPGLLEGMLLGGGYGRGEGGVLRTSRGDRPYNDLEFYVFTKGPAFLTERKFQPLLHDCAHRLSTQAELEIELRAASLRKLRQTSTNMFYYDLVMGHRRVVGDNHLLRGCEHHRNAEAIPVSDASQLLLNRCSGLLFARQRLRRMTFSTEDADFVGRNIAKAKLAMGDVLLTASHRYHWSCLERHQRIRALQIDVPCLDQIRKYHADGVNFKLHPQQCVASETELARIHEEVSALGCQIWLWLESRRLGRHFQSIRDYAESSMNKCAEKSALKNALINFRIFGKRGVARKFTRYPRERLFNVLPLLLWSCADDKADEPDPGVLRFVQRELLTNSRTMDSLVGSYRALWSRFN